MEKFRAILQSIEESTKDVKILPLERRVLDNIKELYAINTESILGSILYNTGGIVIDNWIRIYGAGELNFVTRNRMFPYEEIVVGEDILGGLFIVMDGGNIGYFAPDTLEIEDMEITFAQFLYWCVQGDTDTFYCDYRWESWKEDTKMLNMNKGVSFYPFLWAEADSLEARYREFLLMEEIIGMEFEFLSQMEITERG